MREVPFGLKPDEFCPIFRFNGFEALFDTGAVIPVFSYSDFVMTRGFGAKLMHENIPVGGIGGKSDGKIYRLHNFPVGEFMFSDLDVFVPEKFLENTPILFSVTMFHGLAFKGDPKQQKFIVEIETNDDLKRSLTTEWLRGKACLRINGVLHQELEITPSDIKYIHFLAERAKAQQRYIQKLQRRSSR